jgi:uncharacterized membrane protein
MTDFQCPIEGCDYGESEEKSLAAVRSHVNSTGDDDHEWSDLKALVEQQDGNADQQEAPEEQGESAETDENDQQEENTETSDETTDDQQSMPTDEEYRHQQSGGKPADDDQEETTDGTTETTSESGGFLPALDGRTLMLLLGLLAALAIGFLWVNRDSSDDVVSDADVTEQGGDDDQSEAVSNEEVTLIE